MKINPEKGDFVKVLFKDKQVVEEGYVLYWGEKRAVLKSVSSNNLLIINNPDENVLAVQIIVEQPEQRSLLDVADAEELKPDKYYRQEDLRAKKLAELRILKGQEERKRARELVTTFKPSGLPPTTYDIPRKLQSIPNYTKKKA